MSRFFLAPHLTSLSLLFFVGCSDPYAAPRDGGTSAGGDAGGTIGEGGAIITDDSGASTTDTSASHEEVGSSPNCFDPGKSESSACGNCGTRVRLCGGDLKWSEWSSCSGEGVCTPSDTDSESCGTGGTRSRTCTSSCTWGSFGECVGGAPPCGSLGATDSAACGNCGTKTRTCEATGWGSYGACTGEGVCAAGATDSASCGTGGTKTRTCGSTCTWGSYGTCVGGTTSGCAGTVKQTFSSSSLSGMWGCSGSVSWSNAYTLCAAGMHVCTASEFQARRSFTTPSHHYWTDDYLAGSGTEGACKASVSTTSNFCPSDAPMRVCGTSKTDSSGNYCTWVSCGYESTTSSLYWGGCNDDGTGKGLLAGALCCN
ncbi:MAG: hypothetical protein ACXVEF_36300 [Polyangiales bacterium]